ncbi:PIN domain-containing protein [Vacuolonema iberomarrocanum]|uniref:PIN domain-containing protein n=1 Tax=Vacuolonema iberomarrocanum TaxID=3454632 RepID=UPI0019E97636|nr:hypothetical protein [filamentous cyanobacterium LEGE 07170]
MTITPPVIVVLDISALSLGSQREWLEFSRVGEIHIPQAVYEEMKFLHGRTPDPDLEALARAFHRFYPSSRWNVTDATAHHPSLTAAGQALTKRARIALASARCAYALALNFPNYLTVLVTNDRALLQKIYAIPSNNFCAVDGQSLLRWCRSGQRPISVSQKLQQLRSLAASGIIGRPTPRTTTSRVTSSSSSSRSGITGARRSRSHTTTIQRTPLISSESVSQLISLLMAFGGVLLAGWLLWAVFTSSEMLDPLREPFDPTEQSG